MKKFVKLFCCILAILHLFTVTAFTAEKVYFYHTDPAGTPLAMTDENGNVVWRADYKPFGEEQAVTPYPENNRMFVGKEKDRETGLYYFGARYMEPMIGRFMSPDPVGPVDPWTSKTNYSLLTNPQRLNPYAYGLNNPYRYVDPDGRFLDYAQGASPQFKKHFKEIVTYLNKGKVSGPIAELHSRPEVVYIKEAANPHDFYYNPKTKTIVIDSLSGLKISPGKVQTPALGTLHEVGHALQHLKNSSQFNHDANTFVPGYDDAEERRVITNIETPAAIKLNEPTRTNHGGMPTRVKCPTCNR